MEIEEKKPACDLCGEKLADMGALKRHLKSHSGAKDWKCEVCGKAYATKRTMDQHFTIVHLNEKNFPCEHCGKVFGRKTSLIVHTLTHTGELPFKCTYCDAGFKEKRNMLNHQAKSHAHMDIPAFKREDRSTVSPGTDSYDPHTSYLSI